MPNYFALLNIASAHAFVKFTMGVKAGYVDTEEGMRGIALEGMKT